MQIQRRKSKAPAVPGLFSRRSTASRSYAELMHKARAAELVVQPHQAKVCILTDAARGGQRTGCRRKVQVLVIEEDVVVFNAERQVRQDPIFDARTDRRSSACTVCGVDRCTICSREGAVLVVDDGGATLHIPKHVVEGIADLARKQPEIVDA